MVVQGSGRQINRTIVMYDFDHAQSITPSDHLRQKYKISFLCLSYLCVISCQAHSSELPQWYYTGQSWKPGKFKNAVRMIVVSQLLGQSFGGEVKRTVLFEIETVIV